jgi:hypothetical protein
MFTFKYGKMKRNSIINILAELYLPELRFPTSKRIFLQLDDNLKVTKFSLNVHMLETPQLVEQILQTHN